MQCHSLRQEKFLEIFVFLFLHENIRTPGVLIERVDRGDGDTGIRGAGDGDKGGGGRG